VFDKASKWLEQAMALEPDNQALVVLAGEVQLRQGNAEQALATWKTGLKYDPKDPQAVYNLGGILTRFGLDEEAVKLFLEARAAAGKPEAYAINLAQSYETLGRTSEAVREYALALSAQTRNNSSLASLRLNRLAEDEAARPEVIKALGDLKQQGKLSTEGLTALVYAQGLSSPEQALQALATDTPEVLRNLLPRIASRLEAAGHTEVAAACYQRLLREPLQADYAAALALHLSQLQQGTGDWRAALATLTAQKPDKTQPSVGAQLALERAELLLRRAHRPVEALGAYNQSIEVEPDGPFAVKARWGEADVAFALGKYDMALAAYRGLLGQGNNGAPIMEDPGVNPGGVPGRSRRIVLPGEDYVALQAAEALLRAGKFKEADKAFRAVAKANAASPYANDALERVVLLGSLQGNPAGAEEYLQAVSAFDRGDPDRAAQLLSGITAPPLADAALLMLGEIRLWEGKTPAALVILDRLTAADPPGVLAPQAAYLAAMAVVVSNQQESEQRLGALVNAYADSPQAEQAKVVLENWRRQAQKQ
jgi:tetratricopeptide (TPR) repeat protein